MKFHNSFTSSVSGSETRSQKSKPKESSSRLIIKIVVGIPHSFISAINKSSFDAQPWHWENVNCESDGVSAFL